MGGGIVFGVMIPIWQKDILTTNHNRKCCLAIFKKKRTEKSNSKRWSNLTMDRTYFYPGIVRRESNFNHIEKSFKPSPHHTTDTLRDPKRGEKTKNFYPSEERGGGRESHEIF